MVKCCVFFEVRAEFINTTQMSFGFKGLITLFSKDWYIYDCHSRKRRQELEKHKKLTKN
jgi:hypothetical protein